MKKTILKLLLAVLLIGATVGVLASCGLLGGSEFTVTVMDGETSVKTYTFDKDEVINIPKADLAKTGYEVVGVYTDAAMTVALGSDLTATADLTLYVKYRAKTLDIYVDNGLGEETRVSVTYGQPYTLEAPTQAGYRFRNFTYMGEEFPLTGTYTYTNSISITAKWDRIVMLKLYNGSTLVATVPVAEDGSFTLPAVSDTDDKYFGGYLNGSELFGTKQADGSYTGTYTGKTDVDLFYKWDAIPTYTMTVNGLDGQSASYKTGDVYTLPTAPTKPGYRFLGYKMNGAAFAASGTFTFGENITVTAEWSKIVYINVYDGATFTKKVEVAADGSFVLDDVADVAGEKTFEGYVLGNTAFATYDAASGKWIGTYTGTEDATVMYKWEGIVYAYITFNGVDLNPILIEDGKTTYTLYTAAPTRAGFRFGGFTKDGNAVSGATYTLTGDEATEGVVLTAVWNEIYYITIYDGSAAKPEKIEVAADGTVTLPKQANSASHLFDGYNFAGGTFVKVNDNGDYEYKDVTTSGNAFIQWKALPKVNFNTNEGVFVGDVDDYMYLVPGVVNTLPIPQRDNFTFAGWTLSGAPFGALEDGACTYTYETWTAPSEVTLVAKWVSKDVEGEVTGKEYFRELDSTGEILYVFLTGNTYNFETYTLAFANNNGVVTPNSGNNGFIANKVGTFTMTMTAADGSTRTVHCKVETKITVFETGTDTTKRNPENFVNATTVTVNGLSYIKETLDIGLKNFIPDIKIQGIKDGESTATALSLSAIPCDIEVTYFDASTQTWIETKAFTVTNGAITFDDTLVGNRITITITPTYALKEGTNKVKPTETVDALLNNGVNVYTNDELYAAFKDTTKNNQIINVQRNILMALQRENVSSDATAEAVDDLGNTYLQYIHPTNDGSHGVYVRALTTDGSDLCTINGNFFHISGKNLPLIYLNNPGGSYSGLTGENMVNMQASLFLYKSEYPERLSANAKQELTVNDLYVTGNNLLGGEHTTKYTYKGKEYDLLTGSMTFHGMRTNGASLVFNNSTITNAYSTFFSTGATGYEPNRLYTTLTLRDAIVDQYMNNACFHWGQVGVTVENSRIGQGSGPAFQFEDYPLKNDTYGSYLSIDKDTTINNWLSGTEAWFVGYGLSTMALQLQQSLSPAIPQVAALRAGLLEQANKAAGAAAQYSAAGMAAEAAMYQAIAEKLNSAVSTLPELAPTSLIRTDDNGTPNDTTDDVKLFNLVCSVKAAGDYVTDEWVATPTTNGDVYGAPGIRLVNETESVSLDDLVYAADVCSDLAKFFASDAEKKAIFEGYATQLKDFPPYFCYDKKYETVGEGDNATTNCVNSKFAIQVPLGSFGTGMLVAQLIP